MKIIISALSVLAVILLFGSRFVTIGYVETNDRDADSFSSYSLAMGLLAGIIMIFVAFWTYKVHIVAGIIPFGVGASVIMVCAYLLWCKTI